MSEEIQQQKDQLLKAYEALQREARMGGVLDTLSDTASEVGSLSGRIQGIRDRGYVFAQYLENKAEVLAQQWAEVEAEVRDAARRAGQDVEASMDELNEKIGKLQNAQGLAAQTYIKQIEPEMERVRDLAEDTSRRVKKSMGDVPANIQQTLAQIYTIENYLERMEEATFNLQGDEAMFMAVEAEWETGRDKPDGVFYVTDQRIVFEQKEKVGGMLGFGGKRKHEVLWEAPINTINEIRHENKGLLGGVDLIHMQFGAGAPFGDCTVEVKGGVRAKWFAEQLRRAASNDLSAERGQTAGDAPARAAVADAPTACSVCGAEFAETVETGATEVSCVYCGAVTQFAQV